MKVFGIETFLRNLAAMTKFMEVPYQEIQNVISIPINL